MLFATVFAPVAFAIDPDRAMSQYVRHRWGPERGFPQGPVYAIAQTPDGYLWIGTEAGLVRFDGLSFRLIQNENRTTPITSVLGLTTDHEGTLWLLLHNMDLVRYRQGRFENAVPGTDTPYSSVSAMFRTNKGEFLAAKVENGINQYRRGSFEKIADLSALPRSPVISLAQTPVGDVWIGTRDAGLFRSSSGDARARAAGLPDQKINCLLPDGSQSLWIGTDSGVAKWEGGQFQDVAVSASLGHYQALAILKDRDGNLWVGTDSRGLVRLSAGVVTTDRSYGQGEAITALFEDREANLWIGSANGLERLRDSAFVTYSAAEGLPSDKSGPVYVDPSGRTWFAPSTGGLACIHGGDRGRIKLAGLSKDVVYSITGDRGGVWVGRQRGGLTHLKATAGGTWTAHTYTAADGLAQNSVYATYLDRAGAIWAGTLSGGVSRLDGGAWTTYTRANGLASNTVADILQTADGTMCFATPNGLSALNESRWRTLTTADGLPSDDVTSLLEDAQGVLWIGSAAGISFRRGDRFNTPAVLPPSLHEPVFGIAEDKNGFLWVLTQNHLIRVKRESLLRDTLTDGDIREYGLGDGLHSVEGVKRNRSVAIDPLGRIWFSLSKGLSFVNPARQAISAVPAFVQIQSLTADGSPSDLRQPVGVPPRPQRIVFGYAGMGLSMPERVRFRYRLEGFEPNWSDPVTSREAAYTNLGPGSYRFRVIASNADGVWGAQEAVAAFDIKPAVWQAWWFRLLAFAGAVLSVLSIYRFRVYQMSHEIQLRFEERLNERTRIAQELHDTLLQGFLSASMHLHLVADRLTDDSPAKLPLNRVLQLMSQVIDEGRNAVQGLRSSSDGSLDFETAFANIQQELLVQEDIGFRVIIEGQPRPLQPLLRDEIYRISREALANAFRHSRGKNVEIEVVYDFHQLRVLVRDDGCGIDPQTLRFGSTGHWGLKGMRERAERIGAKLQVLSSATAGTEVNLVIPAYAAFQRPPAASSLDWLKRWRERLANGQTRRNGGRRH